ncbi:calcineurin-like phosphoesterase C-terminal domain-containing protein [Olivibacter jilunii]|uniref:calcineurin-like phosphoesterase C-terminal domain-containing protein n=1 Tax=Olivibacter jilunii TaxID=985016 RepID=UPI003F171F96
MSRHKFYYLLLFFLVSSGLTYAQQHAKGYVYLDANANGKKDKGEKCLPDVPVSNGREVVKTDTQGAYSLPVSDDAIIFVIKPSGYQVPLNKFRQPQYYYIHKPKGSPPFEYAGVAPTGPLPQSINFALVPSEENDRFRMLVVGDPQVLDKRELGYFDKGIVSEIAGVKNVAFGLTLGDIVQNDLNLMKDYSQTIGKVGVPWYNVLGNHDMNQDAPDSLHAETFISNFGPATYSFNYGKVHVIVLDDNLHPDPRGGKGLWGGYRQKQLDFVENDLKYVGKDQLIILANHIQLNIVNENSFRKEDKLALFSKLKGYPHVLLLSAHTHNNQQFFHGQQEGWLNEIPLHEINVGAPCGNWYSGRVNEEGIIRSIMSDGTPSGYIYLNINGNQYDADYKVAGKPDNYQMGLFHRKVLSTIWWDNRGFIYANFFMGTKDSKVAFRVDGGEWKGMQYTLEPDPAYVAELFHWDETEEMFKGRRPTEPANCTHLWRGRLPGDIGTGQHEVEVRATDMYGKTHIQKSTYRIEEPKF